MSTNNENTGFHSIIDVPLNVIDNFFACHRLREAKEILAEIKEQLFNKNYSHSPESIEHDNTCFFFEKLEELLEAVSMLKPK